MRHLFLPVVLLVTGCQSEAPLDLPRGKPPMAAQPTQAEQQEAVWREHAQALLDSEATKSWHAHCIAAPDLPDSRWMAGSAKGRCGLLAEPLFDLDEIAASLENAGRRMRLAGDFDDLLERIIKGSADEMELHTAFRVFDGSEASERVAEEWYRLEPDGAYANTALGLHYLAAAIDARGDFALRDTQPEALAAMRRLADKAKPHLQAAMNADPRVTPACVAAMRLGRYAGDDDFAKQGLSVCTKWGPSTFAFVREMQAHAMPQWGGSEVALAEVSEYARSRQIGNPSLGALIGEPMLYQLNNPPENAPTSPTEQSSEATLDLALSVPDPYVLRFAAEHQMAMGSVWASIALLSQSVRFAPMELHTRRMRGDYLARADELALAAADTRWVLEREPLDYLSIVRWERLQQRQQGLEPDYDSQRSEFHAKWNCFDSVTEAWDDADECSKNLVDAWPEDPYLWYLRAEAVAGRDRRSERAALRRYLELASTGNPVHDTLIPRAKERLGEAP